MHRTSHSKIITQTTGYVIVVEVSVAVRSAAEGELLELNLKRKIYYRLERKERHLADQYLKDAPNIMIQ